MSANDSSNQSTGLLSALGSAARLGGLSLRHFNCHSSRMSCASTFLPVPAVRPNTENHAREVLSVLQLSFNPLEARLEVRFRYISSCTEKLWKGLPRDRVSLRMRHRIQSRPAITHSRFGLNLAVQLAEVLEVQLGQPPGTRETVLQFPLWSHSIQNVSQVGKVVGRRVGQRAIRPERNHSKGRILLKNWAHCRC